MSPVRNARFARFAYATATVMVVVLGFVLALSPAVTSNEYGRSSGGGGNVPKGCIKKCERQYALDLLACEAYPPYIFESGAPGGEPAVDEETCAEIALNDFRICVGDCGGASDPF
jgi:hypothetical protein